MRRSWMILLLVLMAPMGLAQGWAQAYEKGLSESRSGNWEEARRAFKQAAAYRTDDQSGPTNLPGPVTERRQWRNGAAYSPNFLAAYCEYRIGATLSGAAQAGHYQTAAAEWETLHAKNQLSPESFYFLNLIYVSLGDSEKRMKLNERFAAVRSQIGFRVDTEALAPEESAAVANMMGKSSDPSVRPPTTRPATPPTIRPGSPGAAVPAMGTRVAALPNKYALVIGNSASKIPGLEIPFSSDDAQRVREALTMSAGYPEANVDLVLNATAAQILASAKALSERIPEGATVFLYFSGAGANLDGKDYFAGVDTETATDSSSMVAKADIYRLFMAKRAQVFGFFQANRPTQSGRYFGAEVPMFGFVSQCQATMPGESVFGIVRNGKATGVYTDAMIATFEEFRTNQIPIMEFGWQLFYRIRRGESGNSGGSSHQTPTLPVLTNLASDAKF